LLAYQERKFAYETHILFRSTKKQVLVTRYETQENRLKDYSVDRHGGKSNISNMAQESRKKSWGAGDEMIRVIQYRYSVRGDHESTSGGYLV
jgi:hypothetical protein